MTRHAHGDTHYLNRPDPGGRSPAVRVTIDTIDGRTGTALACPDDAMRDTIFVHDLCFDDGECFSSAWLIRGAARDKGRWMVFYPTKEQP